MKSLSVEVGKTVLKSREVLASINDKKLLLFWPIGGATGTTSTKLTRCKTRVTIELPITCKNKKAVPVTVDLLPARFLLIHHCFETWLQSDTAQSRFYWTKWELLEVIKRFLKPWFIITYPQNRFNSFDSIPLKILSFEFLWHKKRMTLQNFFQNKQCDVRLLNIVVLILREIL